MSGMGYSCNACGRWTTGSCDCYRPSSSPEPSKLTELRALVKTWRWRAEAEDEEGEPYEPEAGAIRLLLCAEELETILNKMED